MKKKIKNLTAKFHSLDNRGTSMVTVIISFALLILCVASFYKVQRMAENMIMSSKDMILNNNGLIHAYYTGDTNNVIAEQDATLRFDGVDAGFGVNVTLMKATKDGYEGSIYYFEEK